MQPAIEIGDASAFDNAEKKRVVGRPIQPGQVLNPKGRPKGSRTKLGEAFVAALHADFNEHGAEVIERVRIEKPDAYLKVIASTLPKDLNVNVNAMSEMSDDELASVLAAVRALAASFDLAITGAGAGQTDREEQASHLPALQ